MRDFDGEDGQLYGLDQRSYIQIKQRDGHLSYAQNENFLFFFSLERTRDYLAGKITRV